MPGAKGDTAFQGTVMQLSIRPMLGIAAGTASMAFVILAGVTAPRAETALHASAACPDEARELPLPSAPDEAQRPA